MQQTSQPILSVRNLKTYFHQDEGIVRAVDGASFDIYPGRTLGIVGESGCGKSVTARSILQIVDKGGRIEGGEILLRRANGTGQNDILDLAKLKPDSRQARAIRGSEIALIFQEPMTSFSPVHTVGSQIMEAILLHQPVSTREARDQAIETLRLVGMPKPEKTIDNYPHQLSGGMRQRAMIAMALACNPKLVIADEPTTALDVTIEAQILELLKDLQNEFGMAIMYISHDLAVVGGVADEIIVMYLGLVMEHASAEQLFENPRHPYTQALLRSIPTIDGTLERLATIQGAMPSPFTEHMGCPFFTRCDQRVPGACDVRRPPIVEVEPGHKVRCVLYE
ncbi:MAG: ABC transporter ATP-binding protein [Caldilineaceae bacterium]|nr:ABC transporter ATP-binding protein [Caldilineaceae bacterium]